MHFIICNNTKPLHGKLLGHWFYLQMVILPFCFHESISAIWVYYNNQEPESSGQIARDIFWIDDNDIALLASEQVSSLPRIHP